ncbi:hypothetical protein BGZ54_009898 [Gamsiella multidivaricata]|nr:hypothetical protein BGZ54_009898 [Gamsiella multidivaricata]
MGAHWKREKVQDHKFDFINVDDFIDNSCWLQFRYMLVFAAIMRGILVYCSDIFTAVNLLTNSSQTSFIPKTGIELDLLGKLPFDVYKYLFSVCILLGFVLLGLEIRRAKMIIASRDISYAFTSLIASRYYTVRSYPHFCLFSQINNSKKTVDEIAFFCFFTFRNWKRLMLADAPRQVINATVLYQVFHNHLDNTFFDWNIVVGRGDDLIFKKITLGAMMFTVAMFALSLIMLISAVILYIPLVSHIQGNLKEYCCHKIDKRIDELIKKKTKSRATEALNAQAKGGKNNKNNIAMNNLKQPTLPQLDLLEAPPPLPATTPRNVYNQVSTPSPYPSRGGNGGYGQQQDHSYYNSPSPQQAGYTGNYASEDYFQAKPPSKVQQQPQHQATAFDPYAESAFTTEDIYDSYSNKQDQQQLQQKPGRDMYGDYYNTNPSAPQAPSRPRRYDDHSFQRTASPVPGSQHGSDMESSHNGNNGRTYVAGNNGYGGGHYGNGGNYNNNNDGVYGGYSNDYYPSSGQGAPNAAFSPSQRSRRQDTAPSRNQSTRNGGY